MIALDIKEGLKRAVKYMVEGLAVALAAYYIPKKTLDIREVIMIALTAGVLFALLDVIAPTIGGYVKTGVGIGIGMGQAGIV